MTERPRFSLRLRRRLLRGYEIALGAALVAMALAAALPSSAEGESADDSVHCGNTQNSSAVTAR